jgi:hypothetical protein
MQHAQDDYYPIKKKGTRRRLNPNRAAIEWLDEDCQSSTTIVALREDPDVDLVVQRTNGGEWTRDETSNYVRPMIQVLGGGSATPRNFANPCPACDDWSRTANCADHPERNLYWVDSFDKPVDGPGTFSSNEDTPYRYLRWACPPEIHPQIIQAVRQGNMVPNIPMTLADVDPKPVGFTALRDALRQANDRANESLDPPVHPSTFVTNAYADMLEQEVLDVVTGNIRAVSGGHTLSYNTEESS